MKRSDAAPPTALSVLKLLADDTRWALLRALRTSDYQVGELVEHLKLPQNLASYHLNTLRQAGLVQTHRSEADARVLYYGLDLPTVQAALQQIGADLHLPLSSSLAIPNQLVVFLCTGNSARSQMAEGWLRQLSSGRVQARSAGTQPRSLHPLAVEVMAEAGVDIGYQRAKTIADLAGEQAQIVVTVCDRARETCSPCFHAPVQLHWSIADPVGINATPDDLAPFRAARDELRMRVAGLITALPDLAARPVC